MKKTVLPDTLSWVKDCACLRSTYCLCSLLHEGDVTAGILVSCTEKGKWEAWSTCETSEKKCELQLEFTIKGSLTRDFWRRGGPGYPIRGHFEVLQKFAETFESKGWSPVSLLSAINYRRCRWCRRQINRQYHEINKSLGQGLIIGVKDTGNKFSPVTTIPCSDNLPQVSLTLVNSLWRQSCKYGRGAIKSTSYFSWS